MLYTFDFLLGVYGLKKRTSFYNLLALCPNMLPEISLEEDFTFWRDDGHSYMLGINIDPHNIRSFMDLLLLVEVGNKLQI